MDTLTPVNNFSLIRFNRVCRRFWVLNRQRWLIGFGAGFGFLLVLWLLPILISTPHSNHYSFEAILSSAFFIYTAGGLLLTSHIFHELHSPASAFQLMTLPATSFEKLLSAWFLSSAGYTLAVITGLFGLSFFIETISAIRIGSYAGFSLFNPFSLDSLIAIGTYLGYQSIFLFGAVYFIKNNFFKTILSLIIIFVLITTISAATLFFFTSGRQNSFESVEVGFGPFSTVYWIFWLIVIPIMVLLSYYRLKKREVV